MHGHIPNAKLVIANPRSSPLLTYQTERILHPHKLATNGGEAFVVTAIALCIEFDVSLLSLCKVTCLKCNIIGSNIRYM
jgi:hypothetical protein